MPNNILMILADDMPYSMSNYMPETRRIIQIPGTNFNWNRCNMALCQPCRVSLLTGMYYKRHQISGNGEAELVTDGFDHNNTVVKWLHDAGYRTLHVGKYLNVTNVYQPQPTGYDTWRQVQQMAGHTDQAQDAWQYDVTDGTTTSHPGIYQADWIEQNLISFLAGSEPWFAMVCPTSPHTPMQPAPQDIHKWTEVGGKWPLNWETPTTAANKPSWISGTSPFPVDKDLGFRTCALSQLRELANVDRMIKNAVASLSQTVLNRTNILFASDNGLYYGEHRNPAVGIAKVDLYDCATRVPLWCSGTGFPAGLTVNAPTVIGPDLTATILGIAGVTTPPWAIDGIDLRLIAANPSAYNNRAVLLQRGGGGGLFVLSSFFANGLATSTRKFIQHEVGGATPDTSPDRWELYDLINDPNELQNMAYAGGSWTTERTALKSQLDAMLV